MNDKIRAVNPDFFMVAENWYDANSWLSNRQFDSVMNYSYMFTLVDFFTNKIPASNVVNRLQQLLWRYPDLILHQLFNLIDTHDTARIKTLLPVHYNAVIGLIFAMPGTPSVYYGTEAGMVGENDPDCRRPMTWHAVDNEQHTLLKRLIQFRKHPVAQQVEIQFWSEGETIYFLKHHNEPLLGILSKEPIAGIPLHYQTKHAFDIIQDEDIVLDKTMSISNYIGLYLIKEQ